MDFCTWEVIIIILSKRLHQKAKYFKEQAWPASKESELVQGKSVGQLRESVLNDLNECVPPVNQGP
jgi:hypothetical protein